MLLVGLTGGIASGKSTVSARFADLHGFPVVDADLVARAVVEPGTPALAEIAEHFGPDVIADDGTLDRPALAAVVFADDAQREFLNAITHPRIGEAMQAAVAELADHDGPVVVDSPLLVEMGHAPAYPLIVVVAAPPEVQLQRLLDDRGMDEAEARGRIASQAPLAEKLAVATHVIDNAGTLDELHARIDEVAADLRRRVGSST
jgi:dephospho-CoA kinase